MKRMTRILPLVLLALGPMPARAQSKVTSVEKVADGVWMAQTDQGVNAAWFLAGESVFAIDAGSDAATGKALLQKIAETAGKPVRFLIITHAHGDHAGGVGPFVAAGATVLCQESAALPISQLIASETKSSAGVGVIFDRIEFFGGSRRIAISHFGPAHTKGDLMVFLPDDKVLFAGDVVATNKVPYMQSPDVDPKMWEQILRRLAQAVDADQVVAGHGALGKKESILSTLSYVGEVNKLAKDMIAAGVPDQLIEAKLHDTREGLAPLTINDALVKNVRAAVRAEKEKTAASATAAPSRTPAPPPAPKKK